MYNFMYLTIDNFNEDSAWSSTEKRQENRSIWLHPQINEVDGGKIEISDIDKITEKPNVDTVSITGLNQETFEYFIKTYGKSLRAIRFYKNKDIKDWSMLSTLPNLEFINFYYNKHIHSFWDMSQNKRLKGISIGEFTKLRTLKGIETAENLESLEVRSPNNMWEPDLLKYIQPRAIKKIGLYLNTKEVINISYINEMPLLQIFDFQDKLLFTEQVAWIIANFPQLSGCSLKFARYRSNLIAGKKVTLVFIIGRRKPNIEICGDKEKIEKINLKIEKYEKHFNELVNQYRGLPYSAIDATIFKKQNSKQKRNTMEIQL